MTRIKSYEDPIGPRLTLVPVPVGNDGDITLRAVQTLREADLICCEDTRTTGALLHRLGIEGKRLVSLYSQVESHKGKEIAEEILESGWKAAFCSDAGTPGISDPGGLFAKECIERGIPVTCLPGPSAAIAALAMSGLDASDFSFYGFLSPKREAMIGQLQKIQHNPSTLIFYESPVRLPDALKAMGEVFGNRRFAVLREISKPHEEAIRGMLEEAQTLDPKTIRGECVIVVEGHRKGGEEEREKALSLWALYKENGISPSLSTKLIAKQTGAKKNEIYRWIQKAG